MLNTMVKPIAGEVLETKRLRHLTLTETSYPRNLFLAKHSHGVTYLTFVIEGTYQERFVSFARQTTSHPWWSRDWFWNFARRVRGAGIRTAVLASCSGSRLRTTFCARILPAGQHWAKSHCAAGVHPVHLCREFRRHYRVTIGDFLRSLRIDRARTLLINTRDPICDIALACGFADQSHFSTTFKTPRGHDTGAVPPSLDLAAGQQGLAFPPRTSTGGTWPQGRRGKRKVILDLV